MAKLYITEFSGVGYEPGAATQAPKIPPIAEQAVTFTTSTQSAAFNASTTMVRLIADAACRIEWGTNPSADANNMMMAANAAEFFVLQGTGLKLAVYDGTS
jgi:hypothetical protein